VFVVIEGIEGSGKSTLLSALAAALRSDGHEVVVTREPGGTPLGDAVREIFLNRSISIAPLTESLLVNAARAQHVAEVIQPALEAGRVVLCDRFTDSTLAYQGYGRGLDLESLRSVCAIAAGGLEPGLTLLLDAPVNVVRARLRERSAVVDRIESEDDGFLERVRSGFLALTRASSRHRVIEATLPPERVLEEALQAVRAGLGARVS
jgi:dTMP kinase